MAAGPAEIHYHSAHPSMEALYTAVQHAAFAQGFAVRRARTTRARAPGRTAADAPFNRIEIGCRFGGTSTATVYRSRKTKTGCPFRAVGSLHKSMGDAWLLRVVDGTHNHPPDAALLDDAAYRDWFCRRRGGAWELEEHVRIARMASVVPLGAAEARTGGGRSGEGVSAEADAGEKDPQRVPGEGTS